MSHLHTQIHKLAGGRLRGVKKKLRQHLAPLRQLTFGTFDSSELKHELERCLCGDWDILFVHSSMDEITPMYEGDAFQVLQVLEAITGDQRTLAMPAFFFGDGPDGDMVAWYRANPVFKARRTPSQMGLVTELFRRAPRVLRSLHPTHSVCARGPLAQELTTHHDQVGTALGKGTPFDLMAKKRTVILGIGTRYDWALTQTHHCEELLGDAFPAPFDWAEIPVTLIDTEKREQAYVLRKQQFHGTRDITRLASMMNPGDLQIWRFHGIPMFLTSARAVSDALLQAAEHGKTLYQ